MAGTTLDGSKFLHEKLRKIKKNISKNILSIPILLKLIFELFIIKTHSFNIKLKS